MGTRRERDGSDVLRVRRHGDARLRLNLLGGFELERDGAAVEVSWERPTARTLVKLLATTPGHSLHRDQVIDLLWPDAPADSALNSFRKALHWARHAIEPELERGQASHVLHLRSEVVNLDAESMTVDVDEFEALAAAALRAGEIDQLEAALAVYGGELLPEDRYADWAEARRAELADLSTRLILELTAALERRGAVREAADRLRQLLQQDPTREEIARRLMRLLVRSGNRHEALRQFQRTADVMQRELGAKLEPETMDLHAELLSGDSKVPSTPSDIGSSGLSRLPTTIRQLPETAFVGRERATQLVAEAIEPAMQGHGGLVLVSGEAGVGKTRFVIEILRQAECHGPQILWGASYAREGHFPYGPFVEALESYLRLLSPVECTLLADSYPELRLVLPALERNSSIRPTQSASFSPLRDERGRLFGAMVRLLDELSERTPLLIVLDDLQGADAESLQLLHHLARVATERRWLVLATYREEDVRAGSELQGLITDSTRTGICHRVRLLRLGRQECDRLVQTFLPGGEPAPNLLEEMYAISQGNPLFVRELVADLRDRGELNLEQDVWRLRGSGEIGVPEQVRELILSRADRLQERTRRVLDMASVAGVEFTFAEIRAGAVLAGTAAADAEGQVLDALDEALGAHMLVEDARGYTFSHPLVRASLYDRLTRHRRTYLHGVLAGAIEEQRDGDVETIAFHYERSAWEDKALHYLERAGDRAVHAYANEAAIGYYSRALVRLGETSDRAVLSRLLEKRADVLAFVGRSAEAHQDYVLVRDGAIDPVRCIEVLRKEGDTWGKQGAYDRALEKYDTAWTDIEQSGSEAVPIGVRLTLEISHGRVLEEMGRYSDARSRAYHAIELARGAGDERLLAQAHHLLARVCTRIGEYEQARDIALHGLEVAGRTGDDAGVVASLSILGYTATLLGEPEQSEEYQLRGVEIAERMGDPYTVAIGLNNLGVAAHARGEYRQAAELYRRCVAIREGIGDQEGLAVSWLNLGEAALFGGDLAEAERCSKHSLGLYERTDDQYGLGYVWAVLGGVAHARGNLDRAEQLYRESIQIRERIGDRPGVVDCWIGLGEVACDRGDLREAVRLHRAARRTARSRAPEFEVRASLGSSRAYLRLRRPCYVEPFLRHATKLAAEHGFGRLVIRAALEQSELYLATGHHEEAGTAAKRARDLARASNLRIEEALALRWLGVARSWAGDSPGASECLQASLRLLEEIGADLEAARTRVLLAQVYQTEEPRRGSRAREIHALLESAQATAITSGAWLELFTPAPLPSTPLHIR